MKTKIIIQATLCAAVLGLAASASAQVPIGSPSLGLGIPVSPTEELIATGTGNVTVTAQFLSDSAADDDQLFLYDVKNGTYTLGTESLGGAGTALFDNHSSAINSTFNLGSFAAGDELVFELKNVTTGNDYFSGSDTSSNPDGGKDHFDVSSVSGNTVTVGVEDATDFDYNDLVFSFTGVSAQAVPDAAGTMSLLGLGMTGLTLIGRRFRK